MSIKSSPFGKVVLTGEDAARFIRHMNEDKPNPLAQASLENGRRLLKKCGHNKKPPLGGFLKKQ